MRICFNMYAICRYPTQKSAKIQLLQGSFYFMEALLKEGGGGDHLSVAMKRPGGFGPEPISKSYLFAKLPGVYIVIMYNN